MHVRDTAAQEWLFCYGTLQDDATYTRVTGHAPGTSATAELTGWRRFDLPVVPYPGAVNVKYISSIMGTLRSVRDADEWATLDEYEGDEYSRVPCIVQTESGMVSAFVYRFDRPSLRLVNAGPASPYAEFIASVLEPSRPQETVRAVVATLHGAPIGAASFETRVDAQTGEKQALLDQVFVVAALRRLGFGRSLVKLLLDELKITGIGVALVDPRDQEPFYAALGWSRQQTNDTQDLRRFLVQRVVS